MNNRLQSSFRDAVKNWWVSILIGIFAAILGVWCIFTPLSTFLAMTILFVVGFFVGGIFEIIFAITNMNSMRNWGWTLVIGIIDVVFGIILMSNMLISAEVLNYFIIFWILFQSIWGIGVSLDLKNIQGSGWGVLLVLCIVGVLFAIACLFQPDISAVFAAYMLGFSFLTYGIFRIYLGVRLRSIHKNLEE